MSRLSGVYIEAPSPVVLGRRYRVWRKMGRGGKPGRDFAVTEPNKEQLAGHVDQGIFLARKHQGIRILWRAWSKAEGDAKLSILRGH